MQAQQMPMPNQQMTQGMPQPQGQGMPQQGAPMPQQGGAPQTQQVQLRGEDVQMLMFQRVKQLTREELILFDGLITIETLPLFLKILPELGVLYEQATAIRGMEAQGEMPQEGMYEEEQGEEEENPFLGEGISRGLVG